MADFRRNRPDRIVIGLAWLAVVISCLHSAGATEPGDWIAGNIESILALYRHFHEHPELSNEEKETAARLASELTSVGARVTANVGGHGVVGILENGTGPTLMIRTDLDALPVSEQTGLAFSSRATAVNSDGSTVGVMHACGHDIHMASFVGVARYMAQHVDQWRGRIVFIGQPAEERGTGALAMLGAGLFERYPRPDYALALHVDAELAAHKIGYRAGYILANTDSVDITVKGRGGHGAFPHKTIDPIVQAARLILDLQTIVSREIKPTEPAVITVGSIHGGSKHNVIGDTCLLQITVRSYSPEVRKQLLDGIQRKAKAVALSAGADEPDVKITEGTPALRNDEPLVHRIAPAFERVFGPDRIEQSERSMGGEDFSQYGRAGVPVFMFRVGTVDAKRLERFRQLGQEPPSLHSPRFYPDADQTLPTAMTAMITAALELLKPASP
jgi:hippurate hydrolase